MKAAYGLLLATAIACASPTFAADAPMGPGPGMDHGMMDRGPGMMGGGMMHGPMMMTMMMPGKHIEGRLAFLKTELKIRAKQEQAWNAYADATRANEKRMADMMGSMPMPKADAHPSAPDAMKMHIDMMQKHLDAMKASQASLAKLYTALDDSQKKTADELFEMHMEMMSHN